MKFPASFLFSFAVAFSHTLAADNTKPVLEHFQFGPGVTGTLVPMQGKSPLVLTTEQVVIYLKENKAEVRASYFIYNPQKKLRKEKVGIPSIDVNGFEKFKTNVVEGQHTEEWTPELGKNADFKDYEPYLPFARQFDLKEKWLTTTISVPPKHTLELELKYEVPYLAKKDILKGRRQESPRYFKYLRAQGHRWNKRSSMAAIYVRPRVQQERRLWVRPNPARDTDGSYVFRYNHHTSTIRYDIIAQYDPIEFQVTPFGLRSEPPMKALPNFGYENLFDGDVSTAFCEAETKAGQGKSFEIEWGKLRKVKDIEVFPGNGPDIETFQSKNSLKTARVYLGKPGWLSPAQNLEFGDAAKMQKKPLNIKDKATHLVLQIKDVYPGKVRHGGSVRRRMGNDTCIAEIKVNFSEESE